MLVATILLLCPIPQITDTAAKKIVADSPSSTAIVMTVSESGANDPLIAATLPSTPEPKANATPAPEPIAPAASVVQNASLRPTETRKQKRIWYGLMVAANGAAVMDAWSTRRALSGNYGREGDPLMRPFAHNNSLYAATQVAPIAMDFIGRRMMISSHPLFRRFWWVPQSAGAALSFSSAVRNIRVVN